MITIVQYTKAVAVVPSDTVDFVGQGQGSGGDQICCSALYIGNAGTVPIVFQDNTVVNFICRAADVLPVKARRVNLTNLTASSLVALYQI